jgi:outer membrane protein assembly factor BamA
MKNKRKIQILILFLGLLILTGCNTTRYVPDGKYLLSDINYSVDNRQINKDELVSYVRQDENLKILGFFKFHLWLYNLSNKNNEKSWFRDIGEPPVIYDETLKNKSLAQIQQYLYNKGYYQSTVRDSVEFKKKKAHLNYVIHTGVPYLIRNIVYTISDPVISELIENQKHEAIIKNGDILDVDKLDEERLRITREMNNNGYFKFENDYIHFNIDSALLSHEANIEVVIENPTNYSDPTEEAKHKKFYIKDCSVSVFNSQTNSSLPGAQILNDSLDYNSIRYHYNSNIPIKASTIYKALEIKPGDLYNKLIEERTYNNLYSIREFKYVNIQFQELEQYRDSLIGMLSGKIYLPMQVKQSYSFDVEGTNTTGNLGIAGNLNFQHRNLFKAGEIFDLTFKGATERLVSKSIEFNMIELGATAKLSIPGFIFPINEKKLKLYSMPFSTFSSTYNYQARPDYTRTIINLTFGYQWKTNKYFSHYFNIVDLNAVNISIYDSTFYKSTKDLYFLSSYTDHIISATNYSLIYNKQNIGKLPAYYYFRMNLESAGNTLRGISSLTGQPKYPSTNPTTGKKTNYYELFGTRFAQYIKGDFEYRYGYRFDKFNLVATRAFFGIAFPYGNLNVIPFEKRYYTGGANGIRAWQVRTLGPGSYSSDSIKYPNQSADIKLEGNIEYRFKLFWMLDGALFLDAGNIWSINKSDNREGAVFDFNQFYKEIAVGTGLGLRLVTNYFILRTDLGLKLRDPSRLSGERWIPGNRSFRTSDLNLNIAIGYPF